MKTPFGQECKYYYSDYFRGHETEECRLLCNRLAIASNPSSERWSRALCQTCPVPGILAANQCSRMRLRGRVVSRFLGLTKKVQVDAFCEEQEAVVSVPHVGCGHCHEFK